jgi:hypothetical protein
MLRLVICEKCITPWPESPSYRRTSATLVLTFADRGCCVVSGTDPHGRILGFPTGAATISSK